jgi:hypothetical protein
LKLEPNDLANMPSGIVTKPPKPSFVGFGSTYPGALGFFGWSNYRFCGVAFIEQVFFFGQS